jgi:diaminopimelate epimerase
VRVKVQGGDWLEVGFVKTAEGYRDITLTGPADFVFDGAVSL